MGSTARGIAEEEVEGRLCANGVGGGNVECETERRSGLNEMASAE